MEKVEILTRRKLHGRIENAIPPLLKDIKIDTKGKILGERIDFGLKGKIEIDARVRKARNTWGALRKELFNRENVKTRIKVLLWNALIRSTLTYALQTNQISIPGQKRLGSFTPQCAGKMENRYWISETQSAKTNDTHRAQRTYSNIMDQHTTDNAYVETNKE